MVKATFYRGVSREVKAEILFPKDRRRQSTWSLARCLCFELERKMLEDGSRIVSSLKCISVDPVLAFANPSSLS